MKKKIFMVLSAVVVLAMGVLVVACSKDSNALNPNEVISVEEVAPTQTLQKTNSAAEWAAFNLEIEKLNAKYLAPEVVGKAMRVGRDSGSLSKEQKEEIVKADALGAVTGAMRSWKGDWMTIVGSAIIGAIVQSYRAWEGMTSNGCMISTNPLSSIKKLESDSLASLIGQRHNMILTELVSSGVDFTHVSDRALIEAVTYRYEQLYGSFPDSIKSFIHSMDLNDERMLSLNMEQATTKYVEMVVELNEIQKHSYTEEYIGVIDGELVDSDEKKQLIAGIGTGYHSASLWEIEEQQP